LCERPDRSAYLADRNGLALHAANAIVPCMLLWMCGIDFKYSIVDSGTGRELQNQPIYNIAGLGKADGDRPFRPFPKPMMFLPRSTIRIEVEELSEGPFYKDGELQIVGPKGEVKSSCPLKHTDVVANVAGILNRTHVKQTFHNPLNEKIEAIYVFPLPDNAAVDEMVMTVGDRRIVGQVKKREDARAVYEQAKSAGQVASLLDQERPNVFTQSVANIEPGAQVTIEIAYVETLKFEDGWYEFSFPMVVGPRYIPGQVTDAAKISPPVTPQSTRAGHDVSLTVNLDAGVEIQQVECRSHPVITNNVGPGRATVSLKNEETIPNKDFILRYRIATDAVADALLTHTDGRGSFFTLVLQPIWSGSPTNSKAPSRSIVSTIQLKRTLSPFLVS